MRDRRAALECYLRALWPLAPSLEFGAATPFIAGSTIHLPAHRPVGDDSTAWRWYRAAAAHAAAHRVYSPPYFDPTGLAPIARALLGLLEDARVEALAIHELPGLFPLWAGLHTASPDAGIDFESLMLRLARGLADPTYEDPHSWVEKGRCLFFEATRPGLLHCRPEALRAVALRLGHDVGQMRLQFNGRLHEPAPDYRDDHRWMWPGAEAPLQAAVLQAPVGGAAADEPSSDRWEALPTQALRHYPEWDRLIGRRRTEWCSVFELPAGRAGGPHNSLEGRRAIAPGLQPQQALLRRVVRHARRSPGRRWQASHEGDRVDLDALVRASVDRRLGQSVDLRIQRRPMPAHRRGSTLLLIDQSASSADAWGTSGTSLLEAANDVAVRAADALQASGIEAAICGFSSSGRHDVQMRWVKGFAEPLDEGAMARLAALCSDRSTRLGAALRHATWRLASSRICGTRELLLISDGEPHDVDVHDPHYLVEDARMAVREAANQGVRVACIVLNSAYLATARRIFGRRQAALLQAMAGLPELIRALPR
jgi:nitric oxide reductase NorD protein